mmetsp:Transcript_36244/g.71243  ORF Transcript_36244/g.71243 Transcript_36244/m.71243 type:complete len:386 (+) Transcript_36244:33-1190(+)|eukprot:CAMPEP_0175123518 /NCGR_PEP_ID=MMETSP0087-20121206/2289_1 /TAXON_ID=136419 /ORGANISM="Unknown Unknown, Strain D1" /LENGTH=385 /DNA_ID=CAMNT_0016405221 /DNA_START=25 /DNA_END=1182 /DNA_ORIENTATION=-
MGAFLLGTLVFSLLQLSIVLSVAQLLAWPLDWIGLRQVRIRFTGVYAHSLAQSFVFWMEWMTDTKVVVTGDALPPNERVLAISNHVAVEWLHIIGLIGRNTRAGAFKAVMKESLRYVPIANAGIREGFVTVLRGQGKTARQGILNSFREQGAQLCRDRVPMWLVLFPEGTWITPEAEGLKVQEKSNEFAQKAGYKKLRNVLFPRANGFAALLDGMRHGPDSIDAVYDITVAYNKPYHSVHIGTSHPPSVVQLCSARADAPKEVHFHVTRHPTKDIPTSDADVSKWLCDRFAVEKEQLLDHFDQNVPHRFPGPQRTTPVNIPSLLCHQLFLAVHLGVIYLVVQRLLGTTAVVVFLGLGVVAALLAATGDKKDDKRFHSNKGSKKEE